MKLEIVELAKYKQTKDKEEKETIKKERKLLKRKKQKARKEEEKQRTQENNNLPDYQVYLKELQTYSCDLCNQKTESQDQLRSHVLEFHSAVITRLSRFYQT